MLYNNGKEAEKVCIQEIAREREREWAWINWENQRRVNNKTIVMNLRQLHTNCEMKVTV